MYRVRIRLYAELNDPLSAAARQTWIERAFAPGERVGDLLRALQVPSEEVDLVLLDGISATLTDPAPDGARLSAFPIFERFDIGPLARLRDRPLRTPCFAAEPELARLVPALRLLGASRRAPRGWGPRPSAAKSSSRAILPHSSGCWPREPSWSANHARARPDSGFGARSQ